DRMAQLPAPVLILGGDRDLHTPPEETRQLRAAAGNGAALWLGESAAHRDPHRFAPGAHQAPGGALPAPAPPGSHPGPWPLSPARELEPLSPAPALLARANAAAHPRAAR